jgi:hypothetical protein
MRRFWVVVQARATILEIFGLREHTLADALLRIQQRSDFVTCFAFVSLIQGCVLLLLKLGVCCKSLI